MFEPRPFQQRVVQFRQGRMGVAAVPGSGKTQTLSALASRLIADGLLQDGQEVLVVTLVNSAVDNFTARIEGMLQAEGLLPGMSYRVRTLHGLAHDIVRERPDLAGLDNQFQIIDERDASIILENAVISWLRSNPDFITAWTPPDMDPFLNPKINRGWQELAVSMARSFIRLAKDLQASPEQTKRMVGNLETRIPILEMGSQIYEDYQRGLNYRGAIDFDDLIRLALVTLNTDPDYLNRLRNRWPYILEDEAQDSSRIQEAILRDLVGPDGNWVRVGDPNQAIFETFTTASPQFLIDFLSEPGVIEHKLPNSGRSTRSIIRLANHLVDWTRIDHPNPDLRRSLANQHIELTPRGDPQPNPIDQPEAIHLIRTKYSPEKEIQAVVKSIQQWLPAHSDSTLAVLVPRNERGAKLVEELKKVGIEPVELLRSTSATRETAGIITTLFYYLSDPLSNTRLVNLYQALRTRTSLFTTGEETQSEKEAEEEKALIKACSDILQRCPHLEDYLYPRPGQDWLQQISDQILNPHLYDELDRFGEIIRRWLNAVLLPVDQLLLTIAQELFTQPADLALAHRLALLIETTARSHPDWHLHEMTDEIASIAQNRRKFIGFSEDDTGFDPDHYRGKVVVATIHKAKGLEWDRVYLMSVNNYDFPSAEPYDRYISEKWFLIDHLNLEAEMLSRLKALLSGDITGVYQEYGIATQEARLDYAAERLRLLYVGITRARRELVLTWNTGKGASTQMECQMALPLAELSGYWEKNSHATQ